MNLWGTEFKIPDNTDTVLKKLESPKDAKRILDSKKIDIEDKLLMIEAEVNRILGKYKENTIVLKTKEQVKNYLTAAIGNGIIAIDTETNNSLDPLTCKLMGVCIYTPGQKNAYIPINHINRKTNERLSWQLTETDIFELFSQIKDIDIITHNGKFDYKVLFCTTKWKMQITWDTMIAAKLLNENEPAALKSQYISKIDSSQEKYDIEHLFQKLQYAIIDPELFALYAATDAYETFRLYEYQLKEFRDPDLAKVYKLFKEVEMPILFISAKMELNGIALDLDYCDRLKLVYHKRLEKLNEKVAAELARLEPQIMAWKSTEAANIAQKKYATEKELAKADVIEKFPLVDKNGRYKLGKSKLEQLSNPIELTSPAQLAILLYDILGHKAVSKKKPRGTGKECLEKMTDIKICSMIIEQKAFLKLIDAFIDTLPTQLSPRDNRIHANFNAQGTKTGRFSCTEPNLQQVPSKSKDIRMMFCAQTVLKQVAEENNSYCIPCTDEVEISPNTWKFVKDLKIGDTILNSNNEYDTIKNIIKNDNLYHLYC